MADTGCLVDTFLRGGIFYSPQDATLGRSPKGGTPPTRTPSFADLIIRVAGEAPERSAPCTGRFCFSRGKTTGLLVQGFRSYQHGRSFVNDRSDSHFGLSSENVHFIARQFALRSDATEMFR